MPVRRAQLLLSILPRAAPPLRGSPPRCARTRPSTSSAFPRSTRHARCSPGARGSRHSRPLPWPWAAGPASTPCMAPGRHRNPIARGSRGRRRAGRCASSSWTTGGGAGCLLAEPTARRPPSRNRPTPRIRASWRPPGPPSPRRRSRGCEAT
ncbi:hypothetical protein DFJ74DRAFT_693494 [Hyaloraphidium curvatum]|nr:hypothetical protein DFJ74DRAFT_693494 [Hyaloraphidium curvatum]